MSQILVLYYYN